MERLQKKLILSRKKYIKIILAVDPGNEQSGYVIMNGMEILDKGKVQNEELLKNIDCYNYDILAIEMIASYGMAVGQTVFDTCVWIGRFQQVAISRQKKVVKLFKKRADKEKGIESINMYLCKTCRAKDTNIRQAIIDMYPSTGGGKIPQIGTKKQPGPLYGISGDIWAALAIALTYQGSKYYESRI